MIKAEELTLHEYELLEQMYDNLIEAGLVLAIVGYDEFVTAALTGFNPLKGMDE